MATAEPTVDDVLANYRGTAEPCVRCGSTTARRFQSSWTPRHWVARRFLSNLTRHWICVSAYDCGLRRERARVG